MGCDIIINKIYIYQNQYLSEQLDKIELDVSNNRVSYNLISKLLDQQVMGRLVENIVRIIKNWQPIYTNDEIQDGQYFSITVIDINEKETNYILNNDYPDNIDSFFNILTEIKVFIETE